MFEWAVKASEKNSLSKEIESLSKEYRRYKEEVNGKFGTEQVSFETSTSAASFPHTLSLSFSAVGLPCTPCNARSI